MVDRKEMENEGQEQQQNPLFWINSSGSFYIIWQVSKNCKTVLQTLDSKLHIVASVEPGYRPTSIYHTCVNHIRLNSCGV